MQGNSFLRTRHATNTKRSTNAYDTPPRRCTQGGKGSHQHFDACAIIPFSLLTQRWLPAYSVGVFQTSAGGFEQGSFAATEHEAASAALRL